MKNKSEFISTRDNQYTYSDKLKHFILVPSELQEALENDDERNDYYARKAQFLKDSHFFDEEPVTFQTECTVESIKQNLACLRQLLIEVTDSCNLQCKYCGYGEFYSNHDRRNTRNQIFDNVKILIDHLAELWASDYNTSYQNKVYIGFYGGEPLLNMKLIRECVEYVESLHIKNLNFRFNMTTNAVLLDRYMDYFKEKDFNLLISLDGNEYNNSYRKDKQGKSSFRKVRDNVLLLMKTYPDYFEKNVRFNAVLHDRNSVQSCLHYIKETFNKVPRLSELNTNGITPEKLDEFIKMFNPQFDSFNDALEHDPLIKETLEIEDNKSLNYHSMIMYHCGNRYQTYTDMFESESDEKYLPTGTCKPFERKLFLTVNGKILPCERIGQEHVLAWLKDGKLEMDYAAIARYYSSMYQKVIKNCMHCVLKKHCGQCMMLLKEKDGKLTCPQIRGGAYLQKRFSDFLSYAEQNPGDYERLLSSLIVS